MLIFNAPSSNDLLNANVNIQNMSVTNDITQLRKNNAIKKFPIHSNNTMQKTSNIATIVRAEKASTLSSSDTLKQISTCSLPRYKPGDFPANFEKKERETYSCNTCGDTFVMKSSLTFHLQRRSVLIRFKCDSCASVQVFYNRCSLLSHINAHTNKGEHSDVSKATISPLPRLLLEVENDNLQNFSDNGENSNSVHDDTTLKNLLEVSISERDNEVQSINKPQSVQIEHEDTKNNIKCSECNARFSDIEERKNHFINKDKLPTVMSRCQKCGIVCPSECSNKAHKRLHLQISPYVCPECGDNPDRYWDNFQKHLTYQCFHYARSFGFKCALCNELFLSPELLKDHTTTNHIEILYKCQMCPMAFRGFTNFQVHKRKKHVDEKQTTSEPLQIYKCVTCDVVFLEKDVIDSHCDVHLKENICRYTFRCMECNEIQGSKIELSHHLKVEHEDVYKKHIAYTISNIETTPAKNINDVGLNAARIECMLCHGAFNSRQGYCVHMSKSHSNHKYPCGFCGKSILNRLAMVSHGKQHLKENVAICLLCHNKPIKPPETLDVHLLYHMERVKYQTFCPLCEIGLTSFGDSLQHLRKEHFLQPTTDVSKKAQLTPTAASKRDANGGFVARDVTKNSRSHPNPEPKTKVTASEAIKPISKGKLLSARLETGESCCGKCDFKSADRDAFKKHLLSHKDKKASFQCMECGLCFVVEPSLKKHLKIVHRVSDTDQYMKQEGTHYSPEHEVVVESPKVNDRECCVCYEVFPTESQLKSHMRSHGMAFIQAKKKLTL